MMILEIIDNSPGTRIDILRFLPRLLLFFYSVNILEFTDKALDCSDRLPALQTVNEKKTDLILIVGDS